MPFNPPSNAWNYPPLAPKVTGAQWSNAKGYDNFLTKSQLNQRSRQRGLAEMHRVNEIKRKLKAKQQLVSDLRSEAQWNAAQQASKKHWISRSARKMVD